VETGMCEKKKHESTKVSSTQQHRHIHRRQPCTSVACVHMHTTQMYLLHIKVSSGRHTLTRELDIESIRPHDLLQLSSVYLILHV
jgi:hypothetical protein